jgi:hypothetical protein
MTILLLIPQMERFLLLVGRCRGDVFLHLPNGKRCSLKTDRSAAQILRLLPTASARLTVTLASPDDFPAFLQNMIATPQD